MLSFRGKKISRILAGTIAFSMILGGTGALAQDNRINPFLPNSTQEERILLAEKERMRQAIREMMPEIRSMIMPLIEERTQEVISEMGGVGIPATSSETNPNDPVNPVEESEENVSIPGTSIPSTATFIACMNGKALYRDANGTRYFDENATAVCPQ